MLRFVKTVTKDNLVFTGQLSKKEGNKNLILHIHGMGGSLYYNSFYPFMHDFYPKHGYDFLVVEHRGTHSVVGFDTKEGGTKIIGNTYELFEDSFLDIDAWMKKVLELGYENIVLEAHSLGPSKTVYYYLKTEEEIRKHILALVLLSPVDMLGTAKEDENYSQLLEEAKKLVGEGKREELLSKDLWGEYKLSARTFLNFFADEKVAANIFPYHNPQSPKWKELAKINIPVLAFSGTKDVISHPREAMEILKRKLTGSPKIETVVFEGVEHDYKGFGKQLVEKVIQFLNNIS